MARTREIVLSPQVGQRNKDDAVKSANSMLDAPRSIQVAKGRSETDIKALMECAPHQDPAPSQNSQLALREVLCDAIDLLEPRARYIFDAVTVERVSFRNLAVRMNLAKSHLHREYRKTCAQLAEYLIETNEDMKGRYN